MENGIEQIQQPNNNQHFWDEFEQKAQNTQKKIRGIEQTTKRNPIAAHPERTPITQLIDRLNNEKNNRLTNLDYLTRKIKKGEISQYEKQKTERDITRNQTMLTNNEKLQKKISKKASRGIDTLEALRTETKKLEKQNLHLFKISKKIINFEKLEKNDLKKEMVADDKIKDKLLGIKGLEAAKKFEIYFYQQKIAYINRKLTAILPNEKKQKLEIDKTHYANIINKKTNKFDQIIKDLEKLKNSGKIDNNINVFDWSKLENQDKTTINKAKNLLTVFNNYNDENLKKTLKLKDEIENNIGRPLGETQTDKFRDITEYRYNNSSYQKRLEGINKKIEKLEQNKIKIQNPSPEQKNLDEKQQSLKEISEKLNYLMNKPHYDIQDGPIIDQLNIKKSQLLKEIREAEAELEKKKLPSLKTLREQAQHKLEKIIREYITINDGQKILKLIWSTAPDIISQSRIGSIFDLHKKTKKDCFVHKKILELIQSTISPETQETEPEPPKKQEEKEKEEKEKDKKEQNSNRDGGRNRNKKRGGRNKRSKK